VKFRFILIVLIVLVGIAPDVFCASTLQKNAEWPYVSTESFIKPAPNAIAVGAHLSYAADGVVIWAVGDTVSVRNGNDLSLISSFNVSTDSIVYDFYYRADSGAEILYVAAGTSGLQIYDLSDLAAITLSGSLTTCPDNPGYIKRDEDTVEERADIDAKGIGYYNETVFIADNDFGVRVVDVSSPSTPVERLLDAVRSEAKNSNSGFIQPNINGSYDTTGGYLNAEALRFEGKTYVFVIDYYYGLKVFDVTNTGVINAPVSKDLRTNFLYGSIALITDVYPATGLDSRLYAYVTAVDIYGEDSVVARLDMLTDTNVLEDGSILNIGRSITPGETCGVVAEGDTAYVADSDKGLQIVDVSTGVENAQGVLDYSVIGSYETDIKAAMSLDLKDDMLYMTDALKGLSKINITDKTTPSLENSVESVISGDSVYMAGNHVYLLDENGGLRIFDLSDPATFSLKGRLPGTDSANDIMILDNYAYIANGNSGLRVVDVTDPKSPSASASEDTGGVLTAIDAYISGSSSYLIAADDAGGLISIDITNPLNPGAPSLVTTTGYTAGAAKDVCVSGGYAYYADDSQGLKIVQLSSTPPFSVTGAKNTGGNAIAVAAFELDSVRYAIISDSVNGILIENVTDPADIPATVGRISLPSVGGYVSLAVLENYLFLSAGAGGISVYDISDPSNPQHVCSYETNNDALEIYPYKNEAEFYMVSAESKNGVAAYRISTGIDPDPPKPHSDPADTGCFISGLQ